MGKNSLSSISSYFKIFHKATVLQKFRVVLYMVLTVIEILLSPLQIYAIQQTTDTINNVFETKTHMMDALLFIGLNVLIFLVSYIVNEKKVLLVKRLNQFADYHLEDMKANKMIEIPIIYFEETENHNVLERINGVGSKTISIFVSSIEVIKHAAIFATYAFMLIKVHWSLGFILIALLVPSLYIYLGMSKKFYLQAYAQSFKVRRANYFINLFRDRSVQKEIKIFKHGHNLLSLWKSLYWETSDEQYSLDCKDAKRKRQSAIYNHVINTIYIIGLILFGAHSNMTIGEYVAYSSLLVLSSSSMNTVVNNTGIVYGYAFVIRDFIKFLDRRTSDLIEESDDITFRDEIQLNHVCFTYPNSENATLKDISFTIAAGESVAIVGENGSGKSTLAKCITGLYEIQEGSIQFDGKELNKSNINSLLARTSILFQDYARYELTLLENIAFEKVNNDQETQRLFVDELFEDFRNIANRLPNGANTSLGRVYENGAELSGGEWQRVALSRAFFKEADLIVLDEPTSAIDPLSEDQIFNRFFEYTENKTALIVTHRLANCVRVDKIIVMDKGRIVEMGTHASLMKEKGLYASMFSVQSKPFNKKEENLVAAL
ncbi:ATP-binding cassette subfamily B protein [Paenibacillus pabuli]|uniref:ATP-binding cassette subfamily B protein n=2 Tax=Paenibacillus TaxID=44249 RepID=A0A855YCW5_9BACL|nr:ATP-binding cassette subfamily B protein [Paenibacillus pabuli]PXW07676.1 ATP-binding cassette subfamily B protein [Paenibacillus taichungensis]RAI94559.1 ATP-binding cassette subfamily B protein [Paenibacillus pabuli]